MSKLSRKELEVMKFLWEHEFLSVSEIVSFYEPPIPHHNTISTYVRNLEKKRMVSFVKQSRTFKFYPKVSRDEYVWSLLQDLAAKHFGGSMREVEQFLKSHMDE